ncbi:sugar ABC transporter ATP-binding protein [Rubellimicrobium sp. CFH 75288]|uniref:sugar ABC transporter ATP-binding protein n=1 Tax=Rubellimicrobium sp. CFH 75288 TaxID=2697034 RepID=UPI001412EB77|nr:sugar ABC transporter ATP-binding protein [Rubellimicrobium sp. CFH 75288]NAZ35755.1 ATP-binding cassette domain-containing protein [Rubellimicrobium sp. CFH 75288]
MSAILRFEELGKDWFGVPAVSNLTLDVPEGQVLGLIGENGAGKSTLMNMIGGVTEPTRGRMLWRGRPYAPASAAEASAAGIAFIHQELNLFTNLTVAENLFIDGFPRRGGLLRGLIDRGAMQRRAAGLLARLGLDVPPERTLDTLAPGERQLVEIARALHREASLIIFDEPTTSLTPRETERLFAVIEGLRAEGRTVIYISHILGDVRRLSDRIAVLRDGRLVDEGPAASFDVPRMIRSMIGRDLAAVFPERTRAPGSRPVLEVTGLSAPGVVENISLTVREGEILGLFGLMGSGRSELARLLMGLDRAAGGEVRLLGRPLAGGPRDRVRSGMAFVTENRREEGLMMDATIRENLALPGIESFSGPAGLDRGRIAATAEALRETVRLKAGDLGRQPVRALSGGNQQKVVIGKWLPVRPRLLILDEPTRGVDVGARSEIYAIADRLAAEGAGILMISSEMEELMGLCDRIAVMSRGEIVAEFARPAFEERRLLAAAFRSGAAPASEPATGTEG